MNPLELFTLDVFTTQRFAGNPLGVVVHADPLDTPLMQRIARELNYSETTFVPRADVEAARTGPAPVRVRIFTPTAELPFAGHPTIGTAWLLSQSLGVALPRVLKLGAGEVRCERVEVDGQARIAFDAPLPVLESHFDPTRAAALAGLSTADLDTDFRPAIVRGGPLFAIVRLRAADRLEAIAPDLTAIRALAAGADVPALYLFAMASAGSGFARVDARMFFDAGDLREDPATGSAAVALGLVLRELDPALQRVRIRQGAAMGQPSDLHLDIDSERLRLSGSAVPVIEGRLRLD